MRDLFKSGLGRPVHPPRQRLRRACPADDAAKAAAAVAEGVPRRGDVRQLRRGPALRPRQGHPRRPRAARTGPTGSSSSAGREARSLALIREPGKALELIDRYLLRTLNLQALGHGGQGAPRKIAVVIDFAEFVVPRGDAIQLGGEFSANVVKVLGWANDPAILQSNIVTVLLTEGLHDLNELVVENPHAAKLKIPLPDEAEMLDYVADAGRRRSFPTCRRSARCPMDVLARRLTGPEPGRAPAPSSRWP